MLSSQRKSSFRPHWTVTGRIVYDRPKHLFSPRDVLRVLKATTPDQPEWLNLIDNITEYMIGILMNVGAFFFDPSDVLFLLKRAVMTILGYLQATTQSNLDTIAILEIRRKVEDLGTSPK